MTSWRTAYKKKLINQKGSSGDRKIKKNNIQEVGQNNQKKQIWTWERRFRGCWEAGLKGVSASKSLKDFERGQEKSCKIYPKYRNPVLDMLLFLNDSGVTV